jgi:hypothetical protein
MTVGLIDTKQGWECYVKGQICKRSTEVLGIVVVQFILMMLPVTRLSLSVSPSVSNLRWCIWCR